LHWLDISIPAVTGIPDIIECPEILLKQYEYPDCKAFTGFMNLLNFIGQD
jgi:hypothetical protein